MFCLWFLLSASKTEHRNLKKTLFNALYYIFTKKQCDVKESQWKVNLSAYDDSDFPKLDRVTTPVCLVNDKIWKKFDHGTAIKLENVDLRQNGEKKIEGLRRAFADFYLVEALNSTIWVAVKNQKNEVAKFQKVEKIIPEIFHLFHLIFLENFSFCLYMFLFLFDYYYYL